jgi:hypothetical protein
MSNMSSMENYKLLEPLLPKAAPTVQDKIMVTIIYLEPRAPAKTDWYWAHIVSDVWCVKLPKEDFVELKRFPSVHSVIDDGMENLP